MNMIWANPENSNKVEGREVSLYFDVTLLLFWIILIFIFTTYSNSIKTTNFIQGSRRIRTTILSTHWSNCRAFPSLSYGSILALVVKNSHCSTTLKPQLILILTNYHHYWFPTAAIASHKTHKVIINCFSKMWFFYHSWCNFQLSSISSFCYKLPEPQ